MLMPPNPLVSHENLPTAVLLIRSGRIATAMLEGRLATIRLTVPYAAILTALLEHGPKSATDLCVLTMRERANMSVLLAKLRKKKYISESRNTLDARSHLISLTSTGRDLAKKCRAVTAEISGVIDQFLAAQLDSPAEFHRTLSEFLSKYHSLYV